MGAIVWEFRINRVGYIKREDRVSRKRFGYHGSRNFGLVLRIREA